MTEKKITQTEIDKSYDVSSLLEVCITALRDMDEQMDLKQRHHQQIGAVMGTLKIAHHKWGECHDAMELTEMRERRSQSVETAS